MNEEPDDLAGRLVILSSEKVTTVSDPIEICHDKVFFDAKTVADLRAQI